MLRLVEIALLLTPLAGFVAWRWLVPEGPSPRVLALWAGVLLALAVSLFWLSGEDTLPPGAVYVPPQIENGAVVPGHAGVEPEQTREMPGQAGVGRGHVGPR